MVQERACSGEAKMIQPADDYKVMSEFFPLWRKSGISTALELFCGNGKFIRLLGVGGFIVSGTEPETNLAIQAQREGAFVFPYSLSDLEKFSDGQFDSVGMIRIDRTPEQQAVESIVREGLRIGSKLFFYSVVDALCAKRIMDFLDKSAMNIFARKNNEVEGISLLRI